MADVRRRHYFIALALLFIAFATSATEPDVLWAFDTGG